MVDRTYRELTDEDIQKIARTYHAWRTFGPHPASGHPLPVGEGRGEGTPGMAAYADIPGFCKSATLDDICKPGCVLTPSQYVGAEVHQDDGEPFEVKMTRLGAELCQQQAEAARLEAATGLRRGVGRQVATNLRELGYDV